MAPSGRLPEQLSPEEIHMLEELVTKIESHNASGSGVGYSERINQAFPPGIASSVQQETIEAHAHLFRYEQTKDTGCRARFVTASGNALAKVLEAEEKIRAIKFLWLFEWANRLKSVYHIRGELVDIDLAIRYCEEALRTVPVNDFENFTGIRILAAACYIDRSSSTPNDDDRNLKKAAEFLTDALASSHGCSQFSGELFRFQISWNRSDLLDLFYGQWKALKDLDAAIEHLDSAWTAISIRFDGALLRTITETEQIDILARLVARCGMRVGRSESEDQKRRYVTMTEKYADEILAIIRKSTQPLPLVHDWYLIQIHELSSHHIRERITQDDIERAKKRFEAALEKLPDDDCRKFMYLGAYAMSMGKDMLGLPDAQNPIQRYQCMQDCLRLLPKGILDFKSQFFVQFGLIYLDRMAKGSFSEDKFSRALIQFRNAAACEDARPSIRISGARYAALALSYRDDWEEAADMFEIALGLIRSLKLESLSPSDQQYILGNIAGLSSEAAATVLKAGRKYRALELLELGRGIMARLRIQTRGRLGGDEAARSHDRLISDVVRTIGDEAVVVVNVSNKRSDAFVITKRGLSFLELPDMNGSKLEKAASLHRAHRPRIWVSTLALLWFHVAKPILDSTEFSSYVPAVAGKLRRVCWVLAGGLSVLPIHAAGDYRNPGATVMDHVISSYSSSLTSFIDRKGRQAYNTRPQGALLVGVSESPGLNKLRYVPKEMKVVGALCERLGLSSVEQEKVEEKQVLAALGRGDLTVFHFAGHGILDPTEPSKSGLVLQNGNLLTVAKLRELDLNQAKDSQNSPPFLAYLSACSAGANDAKQLIDEDIHLIGTCQLIGFRHVIGTMWQASDSRCELVAKKVYETIVARGWTDDAVAEALHEALHKARQQWIDQVLLREMFQKAWRELSKSSDSVTLDNEEIVVIQLGRYSRAMQPGDALKDENNRDRNANGSEGNGRHVDRIKVSKDRVNELGDRPEDVVVRADWIPFVHYGP
ncbi:hypothetical protein PMIN07_001171 [Paraphaeosphaeria minitans]